MLGDAPAGAEPQNLEPHKCKGWHWMTWDEIRQIDDARLFIPFRHFLADIADRIAQERVIRAEDSIARANSSNYRPYQESYRSINH